MKIYLKHRERKQFVCIQSQGKGSCELDIYQSMLGRDYDMSYSVNTDSNVSERLSWFSAQTENCNVNGRWQSAKSWQPSTQVEFMEAYKNAKNTIKTFADQLILK